MNSIILAVGRGWIAIDKPYGISVHNDPGHDALALATAALRNDSALRQETDADGSALSPVHRLDRETSGVLLLATRRETASDLQSTLAASTSANERGVTKNYRAIARGVISTDGVWNDALTDKAEGRDHPAGRASDRVACETRYACARRNAHLTELVIELGSGRQHQIRKHAALHRHALIGDTRYGETRHAKMMKERFGFQRLLLHAERLRLPKFGIDVTAPLPPEFDTVFAEVRS